MVCKLLLLYTDQTISVNYIWFNVHDIFIVGYSINDLEWMSWVQETNEKYVRVDYFISMSLMTIVRT